MFFGAYSLIIWWSNCFNTASLTVKKAHVSSIVNIHQWVRRASPLLAANVSVLLKHGAVHLSTLEGWCMRWCSASAQGDDHSQSRQSQPPTPQQRLVNAFTVSWTIGPLQWFTGHWPLITDDYLSLHFIARRSKMIWCSFPCPCVHRFVFAAFSLFATTKHTLLLRVLFSAQFASCSLNNCGHTMFVIPRVLPTSQSSLLCLLVTNWPRRETLGIYSVAIERRGFKCFVRVSQVKSISGPIRKWEQDCHNHHSFECLLCEHLSRDDKHINMPENLLKSIKN